MYFIYLSIIIVGGHDRTDFRGEILSITSTGQWMELGTMQEDRYLLAAAVVNVDKNQLNISACL